MQEITSQIKRGNFSLAEQLCRKRLAEQPADATTHFLLAFVLWRKSEPDKALTHCRRTRSLAPSDPGMLSDLGNLFRELDAYSEALEVLDRSLELRPGNPGTRYNRALVLDALGRDREALQVTDGFSAREPLFAKARFLGGTIRQDLGDMTGAEAGFRESINANPDNPKAWYALALTRRFGPGDAIIDALHGQMAANDGDPGALSHYLFALAKILDDTGQYDAAGDHLLEANRLVKTQYEASEIESRLELLRAQFLSPASHKHPSPTTPQPVFIVGLPRSGSTLVESLLDRHPEVLAMGELDVLPRLVADFRLPTDKRELHEKGIRYLKALRPDSLQASVVLDKMPGNFWRLGHIGLMLPGARIIHCQREPRDVAISNFFNLYATGNSFAYSLDNLAHYTACHDAVMAHWKSLMGERIFSLDYAELVNDPQRSMTGAMEFLGLEWDAAMLEAPAKKRRIKTASTWQVRQRIFTTSVGRWQRYPHLAQEFMSHFEEHSRRLETP
jgi:tetratricopeptide (TPR) repeat protein